MPTDTTEGVAETQHKAATINQLECPSHSLHVHLLWYPLYYPRRMKARVSPVQGPKPHSILPPLRIRTRAAGFRIISGDHYTTTAHTVCYQCSKTRNCSRIEVQAESDVQYTE